jgi:TPP-dependent pyruvate/acetoin dehydrogenase alpha subunit
VPLERAAELGIRQVLDRDGRVAGPDPEPDIEPGVVRRIYETMVLVAGIDARGWQLQRSGRLDFWIPSRGQEASHIASTAALAPSDWNFLADREPGSLLYRGGSLTTMFAQFFGRAGDPLKGRRLPLLLGDRELNVVPCITAVGSYLPHAAGAAWAAKLLGDPTRFIVYFGDGATSRAEFHSTMNFAGIHQPPVVLFCQNNQWAVSTPLDRQTATETLSEKGDAYAVRSVRVDGNDPLAVYAVTAEALAAAPTSGATFIEAVTYRLGYHTSSDNPDLYRTSEEVAAWAAWDPIPRTRAYLVAKGWWSESDELELEESVLARIDEAVRAAEAQPLPTPASQFDDIFATSTWMLDEQRSRLLSELYGEDAS